MNNTTNNKNISKRLPIIIISVTLVVCALVIGIFFYQRGNLNNTNSNDSVSKDEDKSADNEKTKLGEFVGEYSGTSSLLTAALQFPNSSLTLLENGQYDFVADGLDLSATQIEELKDGDKYPVASVLIKGVASATDDGNILMKADTLRVTLIRNGELLDEAKTVELVGIISTKLNLTIPQVSEENPLEIETNYTLDTSNTLIIKNTTSASNSIQINFTGRKK